jgi:hypothetical protein
MRLSNTLRKPVMLTNTETGKKQELPSMTDAGVYLGISRVSSFFWKKKLENT